MKKNLLALLLMTGAITMSAEVTVSILGDSYSTYTGWIPQENEAWYGPGIGNDVQDVSDTWWHRLINDNGLKLELNNSWSGATICNTGYRGEDYTERSFLTRSGSLGNNPDVIFIFGGTNDSWAASPLGETDGTDMFTVRPAAKAMLKNIKANYPDALSVVIINTELSNDIEKILVETCDSEDVPYIKLQAIDKQYGHPSIHGMQQISSQVWKSTAPLLYDHLRKK